MTWSSMERKLVVGPFVSILERYNIQNKVQLELRKNHINITPVNETRKDWDKSLTVMNSKGEDILLIK